MVKTMRLRAYFVICFSYSVNSDPKYCNISSSIKLKLHIDFLKFEIKFSRVIGKLGSIYNGLYPVHYGVKGRPCYESSWA